MKNYNILQGINGLDYRRSGFLSEIESICFVTSGLDFDFPDPDFFDPYFDGPFGPISGGNAFGND